MPSASPSAWANPVMLETLTTRPPDTTATGAGLYRLMEEPTKHFTAEDAEVAQRTRRRRNGRYAIASSANPSASSAVSGFLRFAQDDQRAAGWSAVWRGRRSAPVCWRGLAGRSTA